MLGFLFRVLFPQVSDPPVQAPTKNEVPLLKLLTLRDGAKFQAAFNQARDGPLALFTV